MLTAEKIRARSDIELFNKLTRHADVKRVKEQLERQAEKGPPGVRRRLLATSVRLSKEMAPEIRAMADDCTRRLGITIPVEIYVYASPSFNAACVKPEEGRLFIMFSSSLLERFDAGELRFVMGHELGHFLYRHHDIPIGYLLMGKHRPSPGLALQLCAWSRYAEISADRAGAHCAQDFESVGRGLFKLASGLSGDVVTFNLRDFLRQIDEMQSVDAESAQGAPMEDWFSTHPFSPLRVKALQMYHESELVAERGITAAELEASVTSLMGLMEPSYLESKTEAAEAMRRLLFAGAITVADAAEGISEREIEAFEKFFGQHSFKASLDVEQIKDDLEERVEHARELASHAQCTQVVRDLCVIARADGHLAPEERKTLLQIALKLDVGMPFVERCLDSETELD
jgi:tellurite resistance protein